MCFQSRQRRVPPPLSPTLKPVAQPVTLPLFSHIVYMKTLILFAPVFLHTPPPCMPFSSLLLVLHQRLEMERVELRGVNLINGTTQEERGNVASGGGGERTGTFYLKAIKHSCCCFSWETNKHGTHRGAFPASRMTDRVKAMHTDS